MSGDHYQAGGTGISPLPEEYLNWHHHMPVERPCVGSAPGPGGAGRATWNGPKAEGCVVRAQELQLFSASHGQ